VTAALDQLTPLDLVDQVIVGTLARIGESWERGDTALSQVYMCGDPQRKDQPPMAIAVLEDNPSAWQTDCLFRAARRRL